MKYWTILSALLAFAIGVSVHVSELFVDLGETESRAAATIFAQIAATMLGFLIAALSILASISGHRLLREMQRFFINSGAYAVAMLSAFGVLLFKALYPWSVEIALSLFVFATLLLVDIGWRLWLVLHNLTPTSDD
jgi:hypothetical protein